MDTRLKNRHKLGIILITMLLVCASVVTIAAYPYMERMAKKYTQTNASMQAQWEIENLAPQVMNCVYAIWMEQAEKEAGHMMTPTQVFLPNLQQKLEEMNNHAVVMEDIQESASEEQTDGGYAYYMNGEREQLETIKQDLDALGNLWKSNYRQLLPHIVYTMYDGEGKILQNSTERTLSGHEAGYVSLRMNFDERGRMTLDKAEGSNARQAEVLANALLQYEYEDPVTSEFGYDLAYLGVPFEGPKNVKIDISLDGTLLNTFQSGYGSYDLLWSGGYEAVVYGLCLLVAVAALVLPCFKALCLGQEKIFRVPFEIVSFLGILWACFVLGTPGCEVAYYTMSGGFQSAFVQAGFLPEASEAIVLGANLVFWLGAYAMLYWGITCVRSIFSLGPIRYIKERTVCGGIIRWVFRLWNRFYQEMKTVDWQDNSTKLIRKIVIVNFLILAVISCFWGIGIFVLILYSIGLFFLLRKYWREMHEKYRVLLNGINRIAEGDLDAEIEEDLGIFEPFREQINKIRAGFKKAVDEEVKSQSMKTELITNVSHDLKTPLTAIITYVNLLKDENATEEEKKSYIQVLEQKSMRLKVLIEDLFEVSKANSRNVTLNLIDLDIVSLMKQVRLELDDKISTSQVEFKWNLPEEPVVLKLDSDKTYRIFENLLVNIVKYGMPGSRAYIDIERNEKQVKVSMKNISAVELSDNGIDMTERFVRGDKSRNTEGSGLGLAIAKSFAEVQKGKLEVEIEADLFKVLITWPVN